MPVVNSCWDPLMIGFYLCRMVSWMGCIACHPFFPQKSLPCTVSFLVFLLKNSWRHASNFPPWVFEAKEWPPKQHGAKQHQKRSTANQSWLKKTTPGDIWFSVCMSNNPLWKYWNAVQYFFLHFLAKHRGSLLLRMVRFDSTASMHPPKSRPEIPSCALGKTGNKTLKTTWK